MCWGGAGEKVTVAYSVLGRSRGKGYCCIQCVGEEQGKGYCCIQCVGEEQGKRLLSHTVCWEEQRKRYTMCWGGAGEKVTVANSVLGRSRGKGYCCIQCVGEEQGKRLLLYTVCWGGAGEKAIVVYSVLGRKSLLSIQYRTLEEPGMGGGGGGQCPYSIELWKSLGWGGGGDVMSIQYRTLEEPGMGGGGGCNVHTV